MKFLVVISLLLIAGTDGARVLGFFPMAGKSHHFMFRTILEALAGRGHEVVYLTGFPYEGRSVPESIVQLDISGYVPKGRSTFKDFMEMSEDNLIGSNARLLDFSMDKAPFILGNPVVQKLIHSEETFDVVLMESWFLQEYNSALVHKFGAVGVEILGFGDYTWMNELSGLPDNPSYQIDRKVELTQEMDFWQRLYNTYAAVVTRLTSYYYLPKMQRVMDQFFNYTGWETRPPFGRLLSNRSLVLVNYDPAVGYPTPLPPHRKNIAGVHIRNNTPLPKDIKTFMDESANGVIYFSMGTYVEFSDPDNGRIQEVFLKVFEGLPQRVLIKWESEYTGKLPKNVLLKKWIPQQAVLAHKNCVLFITHGGYLSLTEAVHFSVPVIGIPFFGDQSKNLMFAEEAGIGKMIKLKDVNYKTTMETVKEVLSNKTYKQNIMKRSQLFRDRRHPPVEEAVYWIEYAIKYPNVLTPKGASLSFMQLHLLDVWVFLLLVLFVSVFLLWKVLSVVTGVLKCKNGKAKIKKKQVITSG